MGERAPEHFAAPANASYKPEWLPDCEGSKAAAGLVKNLLKRGGFIELILKSMRAGLQGINFLPT